MRLYEIFIAEIGTYIKFKVLSPQDVDSFVSDIEDLPPEEFKKIIIENVVFNMKTEIVESLKMMSKTAATNALEALFNGCVMLNPGLDLDAWIRICYSGIEAKAPEIPPMPEFAPNVEKVLKTTIPKKISRAKFLNLNKYLKQKVIGQDHAIEALVSALKRSQAGLNDPHRPLGVFFLAGSSGVGKTHLAKQLHEYLFGDAYDIVRIDCGEFQHKHENQKLMGSPPGYVGHDDGGQLTNQIAKHPDTVLLLDEVEKAHPDLWNTFLRIFDEGVLTDNKGNEVSFKDTVIIMTTNLGNDKVVDSLVGKGIGFNQRIEDIQSTIVLPPRSRVERFALESIRKNFRPEFLNRIDKIIIFNHLSYEDFAKIAELELQVVEEKLSKRGLSLHYDESVIKALIDNGVDTVRGARGMMQIRRDQIENALADVILANRCPRGSMFELTYDKEFSVNVIRPTRKAIKAKST